MVSRDRLIETVSELLAVELNEEDAYQMAAEVVDAILSELQIEEEVEEDE